MRIVLEYPCTEYPVIIRDIYEILISSVRPVQIQDEQTVKLKFANVGFLQW
jgi:hypothetical protein